MSLGKRSLPVPVPDVSVFAAALCTLLRSLLFLGTNMLWAAPIGVVFSLHQKSEGQGALLGGGMGRSMKLVCKGSIWGLHMITCGLSVVHSCSHYLEHGSQLLLAVGQKTI